MMRSIRPRRFLSSRSARCASSGWAARPLARKEPCNEQWRLARTLSLHHSTSRSPSMDSIACFLQGVFTFSGAGLAKPLPLADGLAYAVPADRRAQLIYFRAGSSADDL